VARTVEALRCAFIGNRIRRKRGNRNEQSGNEGGNTLNGIGVNALLYRVLLDECVDRRLAPELIGHDVSTVPHVGWAAISNDQFLALAKNRFDVFLHTHLIGSLGR
jgi:hypothetical protein